jgi:NADH:ubiquinone oxidoreductase subunit
VEAMPKKKTLVRNPWTKEDLRQLKGYSKAKTPVVEVAKAMKRTEAAVRQKAKTIGIGLGHRR